MRIDELAVDVESTFPKSKNFQLKLAVRSANKERKEVISPFFLFLSLRFLPSFLVLPQNPIIN
jgi:hypothetical protein